MKRIQLRESELVNLINRVINEEGPIYGPNIGICLCPPPWTPCGCLGQAMNMGIAPEDMDPNDFRGNEDTSRGREFDDYEDGGTELADCRCGGFVEIGEMCPDPLNTRCVPHAGGCHCLEADKAMEEFDDYEDGDTELVGCPSCGSPDMCGCYPNCYPCTHPDTILGPPLGESDLRRLVKRAINEQKTITHEELMDGIDKYCPEVLEKEKMVGNRSCSRCHTPIMGIIKRWCESNKN